MAPMPDPVQRLALSRTLWLIVAPPLAGFALLALQHARGRGPRRERGRRARRVGLTAILLATAATLGQAVRLSGFPAGTALFEPSPRAGAGMAANGFGLSFDLQSATACGGACVAAVAAAIVMRSRDGRAWAWLQLSLAAGLVSFLADGFVTALAGWALAAGAAAWLAGWRDPRAGATRATRGALAVVALLLGAVWTFCGARARWDGEAYVPFPPGDAAVALGARSAPDPSGGHGSLELPPSFGELASELSGDPAGAPVAADRAGPWGMGTMVWALGACLLAAAALSASTPARGAPLALASLGSATFGAAGPFLLLRVAALAPLPRGASIMTAAAGAALLFATTWSALGRGDVASRALALAGGAPTGLTCVSLGTDGPRGGALVLAVAVFAAVLVQVAAVVRRVRPSRAPQPADGLESALLDRAPESAGTLVVTFERWVVGAVSGGAVVGVRALAWAVARFDMWLAR